PCPPLPSFPTRRSSDLDRADHEAIASVHEARRRVEHPTVGRQDAHGRLAVLKEARRFAVVAAASRRAPEAIRATVTTPHIVARTGPTVPGATESAVSSPQSRRPGAGRRTVF